MPRRESKIASAARRRRKNGASQAAANPETEATIPELYQIVIECRDENHQRELFELLKARGCKCRLLLL